jgi:hypothetical protein
MDRHLKFVGSISILKQVEADARFDGALGVA